MQCSAADNASMVRLFPRLLARLSVSRKLMLIYLLDLTAVIYVSGILTPSLLLFSVFGLVPAIAGTYVGNSLRPRIPVAQFRRIVLFTLLVVGVLMLTK